MVYFECDNDGALLDFFSIARADKKHTNSKGNVCNKVSNNTGVIGLVDEDPLTRQPGYISSLGNPVSYKHDIKVFSDNAKNNQIVMICPRLEEWLYNVARQNGIDPTSFGLPAKADDLHKEELRKVKTKLNQFLKALEKTNEFRHLKSLFP